MLRRSFLFLLLVAGCAAPRPAASDTEPLVPNLRTHVETLAADKLEGRRTGTEGEKQAAAYIAGAFEKAGLQPKGTDGYLQPFPVSDGRAVGSKTFFTVNGQTLEPGKDFFPLPYSANATLDATASVALMERGDPWFFNLEEVLAQNRNNPHFDAGEAVLNKAREVAKKGASALVVYNASALNDGLAFDEKDKSETLTIPVFYVAKEAAKKYFADPSATLQLKGQANIGEAHRSGTNVVGYVDNGAAKTVILGAHFDHLGYGEDHNSRYTGADKQIHNGADDNASGTAALIELARMVKAANFKSNNYLFVAFSGEELGLFGSKFFVQHPTIDLANANYMVNMDMVGRMTDSAKTLTVGGFGTSPTWAEVYNLQGKDALFAAAAYRFDSSGTGPSDHTSFYQKNIPVLFYFTGLHTDYHKPTDDFDKLNYTGEAGIVKHIFSLLQAVDKRNTKLAFTKTREAQTATTARFSVTLGIMPDYTFTGAGVRVDGVSDGRPAQKAGIQTGDVITAIGEYKVTSMESYMQTLGKFKKGDKAKVAYSRNGQSLVTTAEF